MTFERAQADMLFILRDMQKHGYDIDEARDLVRKDREIAMAQTIDHIEDAMAAIVEEDE
jgi:hypothetical protein